MLDEEIVELRAACVMFCSHALDHASLSAYALMILNHKYKEDGNRTTHFVTILLNAPPDSVFSPIAVRLSNENLEVSGGLAVERTSSSSSGRGTTSV